MVKIDAAKNEMSFHFLVVGLQKPIITYSLYLLLTRSRKKILQTSKCCCRAALYILKYQWKVNQWTLKYIKKLLVQKSGIGLGESRILLYFYVIIIISCVNTHYPNVHCSCWIDRTHPQKLRGLINIRIEILEQHDVDGTKKTEVNWEASAAPGVIYSAHKLELSCSSPSKIQRLQALLLFNETVFCLLHSFICVKCSSYKK